MNNYKKTVLSNKVPLITIPIKGAKTTTALVIFKTGSKYETRKNSGISHFLEHLFFKGTKKRPNTLALSGEMDSLGGEYNAFTAKEYTGYWFKVTNNKLGKALEIMGDMLFNSLFDAEEIEREKGVIIEELNMYEDNPQMHIDDVFEACLYGDTPAGWETIGTKENIRSFKREDFINYLETQYGTNSVYLIVAGAIKPKDKKIVNQIFSQFKKNKKQDKEKVLEKQKSPQLIISPKKNDQAVLSLGVRAFPYDHPEEFKLKLLSIILGGSMSSRLFINLRARNGLAYYVRTDTEFYSDSGYLTTQAGVPIIKVEEAIKIILAEYKNITTELVSAKELKRAKDLIQGRVFLQMEASDSLANWYARQAMYRRKILTPGDLIKKIKKITPEEIRSLAQKIFINQGLNLAIIGDIKEDQIKPILKL
jgi:predicted Zn-dependent peptidase